MGAVRGYEENLYIAGWNRASSCWCKEKSSTVRVKKTAGWRGFRASFALGEEPARASPGGKQRRRAAALHMLRGRGSIGACGQLPGHWAWGAATLRGNGSGQGSLAREGG